MGDAANWGTHDRRRARIDASPAAATISLNEKPPGGRVEAGTVCLCQGPLGRARDRVAGERRRAAACRRTEPDCHAQHAAERARAAGRHQRHRRARSRHLEKSPRRDRRAGALRASGTLPRDRARGAAHRPGAAAYRPPPQPHTGHPAPPTRAPAGGSLAFADPAAELPACVIALDGEIEIAGPQGQLTVKADEFFKGLFETALTPRDVLTAIRVPAAGADTRVG